MVNTFLVCTDYKESASYLDRQRLGKQRVEAYQILCLIEDLMYLSKRYKRPLPENPSKWKEWVRSIVKIYKKKDYKFTVENGQYCKNDSSITKFDLYEGERLVSLGFVYHPAVLMWIKWPDALKLYINAHIEVWIERGYKNNMRIYDMEDNEVEHPPWIYNDDFHQNHRGALIKKEIDRNEPKHYRKISIFKKAPKWKEYIWPLIEGKIKL